MSEPLIPRSRLWLGIDVGWIYPAADSDGRVYPWEPRKRRIGLPEAGPVKVTRSDGSTFIRDAYSPHDAAEALAKALDSPRVGALARIIVSKAKRSNRGIALEDWTSFERRKAAWVRVYQAIANGAEARDVPVTQVNRAYTSITCPSCGLKDRGNRPSRNAFVCLRCGLRGQSDVIAAANIAAKAARAFRIVPGSCGNPACDGAVEWKAGLCIKCYGIKRRRGVLPDALDLELQRGRKDHEMGWRSARQRAEWEREARWAEATREKLRHAWRTVPVVDKDGWRQA